MWSCAVVLADVLEGDGVLPDGELDLVGEVLAGKLRFPALRLTFPTPHSLFPGNLRTGGLPLLSKAASLRPKARTYCCCSPLSGAVKCHSAPILATSTPLNLVLIMKRWWASSSASCPSRGSSRRCA